MSRYARTTVTLRRVGQRLAASCGLALAGVILAGGARAEPYIAVQTGFKCTQCHVNPTGGGLRNTYGDVFAQTLLPAKHIDTGADTWTGALNSFISIGGDVRYDAEVQQVRNQPSDQQFDLQQARVYLEAQVIPNRLLVYVDEQVAPGGASNREAYGLYWSENHDWYVKAGQFYLPFGLRLQDQTAFVQEVSQIDMTTPDQGIEFGWLRGAWDAQFAVSNGTAGGAVTSDGKQYSSQLAYVQPVWRLGVAANVNDASSAGKRDAFGLFGGLRTGPIAWLAEADLADDQSLPAGQHKIAAGLLEANWLITRGNNLKITAEQLYPDTSVHHNGEARWSLVYELTPIQFVQLRAGFRYLDGIPQADAQHQKLYFLELHGFF
jgi:hypothetical protein